MRSVSLFGVTNDEGTGLPECSSYQRHVYTHHVVLQGDIDGHTWGQYNR